MVDGKRTIELIANIAIVIVCVMLGWTLFARRSADHSGNVANAEAKLVGLTLPSLPTYQWGQHQETLVLAIKKGCHFCEDSVPFYRQLSSLERTDGLRAHLLAVMPDNRENGAQLLQASGLPIDAVFNQYLSSIKVNGTPTLLLLNSQGQIEHAWIGELPPKEQSEVINTVKK